jgi:hypothetical protein
MAECSPLVTKINTALEYLKQPSTIKAMGTLAGAVGYAVDQTKALDILMALQVFFGMVNLFYDGNPRKSVPVPETPAAPPVAPDQVAELVRAEIARLRAASKPKVPSDQP